MSEASKPAGGGGSGGGGRGRGKGGGGGRGRGGGGRGGGRGGRGRGGGKGQKDKAEGDPNVDSSNANKVNNPNQPNKQGGRGGKGRGGGGGGGGGDSGRGSNDGENKNRRRRNNNKGGRGGQSNNKGGGGNKAQAATGAPPPPQKTEEEKKREEEERIAREEAEVLKKRQEEERKAAEAALEARRKEQEALDQSIKEAIDALKALVESTQQHKSNREELKPEALAEARKKFQSNKKSLKTDLKKCTAFVKKIKTGAAWSMKAEEIERDVSTLNLSRYVEEVVTALLDAKLKLLDLPVVVSLSTAMHLRYEEFLTNLLPGLWNVINGKPTEETAKSRRLYVRLITDFVLNGLVTDTKQLVKIISEATGGKDGNYVVTDASLIVAFGKAAGFEIFGRKPRSVQTHLNLIRKEAERAKDAASSVSQSDTQVSPEGDSAPIVEDAGTKADAVPSGPVVISLELADSAMELVNKAEEVMKELAVPPDAAEILTNHCMGAYQTLSNSLVSTHTKLQKLEKRCEQDRLLSGSLTEAREKGLSDARKLLDSLQKSVDTFSDVLDQPLPQLEEEDNEGETDAGGVGLELWTKGGGDGEGGDFGPFDDEETRAFYCDIPDFLTTVPPGLLGLSPEEIETRKAENVQKYGAGFDSEVVEEGEATEEVPFSSEAQLEAEEEAAAAGLEGKEEGEDGKSVLQYHAWLGSFRSLIVYAQFQKPKKRTRTLHTTNSPSCWSRSSQSVAGGSKLMKLLRNSAPIMVPLAIREKGYRKHCFLFHGIAWTSFLTIPG
jgi:beta-phosphoglucomutase-like phosphatase (HAD superfamily)